MIYFTIIQKFSIIIPSSKVPEQHNEYTNACNDKYRHYNIQRQSDPMFVQNT